jgi:hypothetical protein
MNDTFCGNFLHAVCSDCGEKGCSYKHWGLLVPKGKLGQFCHFCWSQRMERKMRHGETRLPLGIRPPGIPEKFSGQGFKVTTKDKTIYRLRSVNVGNNEVVIVSVNGKESFSKIWAKVMRLRIKEGFVFRLDEDRDNGLFFAPLVVRIEPEKFL